MDFDSYLHSPKLAIEHTMDRWSKGHEPGFLLGAGLSKAATTHSWTGLVKQLCSASGIAIDPCEDLGSSSKLMELVGLCKKRQREHYLDSVFKSLYSEGDDWNRALIQRNSCLELMRRLSYKRGKARAICLNFDSFADEYLRTHSRHVKVTANANLTTVETGVYIHHTHGYLPKSCDDNRSDWIIFSDDEYKTRAGSDEHSGQYRALLLDYFRSHFTIVLGVGGAKDVWQIPTKTLLELKIRENNRQPLGIWLWLGTINEPMLRNIKELGFLPVAFSSVADLNGFLDDLDPM